MLGGSEMIYGAHACALNVIADIQKSRGAGGIEASITTPVPVRDWPRQACNSRVLTNMKGSYDL